MKKVIYGLIAILILLNFAGCGALSETPPAPEVNANTEQKLNIVTTLFPQYDFTKQIVKDKANVTLLLPPGTESHTFDPKPSDMLNINNADIFIYTGKYMEPWAEKVISGISQDKVLVIDCSSGIELQKEDHEHEEESEHEDTEYDHEYDPHIWLDPTISMKIVDNILLGLIEKDSINTDFYSENAKNYQSELQKLDADFFEMTNNAKRDTIVFGGRFSYYYFLNHYAIHYESAYDSCAVNDEPSLSQLKFIIDYIKENDIPYIYHEEFVEPKVANSIAKEAGISTLLFSTAHNISKDEFNQGITYIDIMRENLKNLEKGLN